MTQKFIGTKLVTAWPQEKDGKDGYAVKYEDGYTSWSPRETFLKAYYPMGHFRSLDAAHEPMLFMNENRVTPDMVDGFIANVDSSKVGEKTTLVNVTLINGFEIVEQSSCVDPANYDAEMGVNICLKRARDKIWFLLGFLLQTAKNGVRPDTGRPNGPVKVTNVE